ncbi:MAG: capsular biosynthesis protein [Alphaproteobacteria bacterium HGW-Alphaproteobacteria-14]|nr:MAG: capsular biosynthesis protein [Alphaproteobacteria bacterium HGW-Alphaproteobacteria-14]
MGPFFQQLGRGLRAAGHAVFKVNFNGGDRAYWRLPNGIDYRGTLSEWPDAFADLLQHHQITDVMLFGDCRDHHISALKVCRERGVSAWVFEEGYIRPDWVTMELGGVNGHSDLPRDPQFYRDRAAALPPAPEHRKVPSSFRRRASEGFFYNAADVLTRWRYPGWHTHRPWHPLVEGMGWARKLSQSKKRREQAAALIARLLDRDEAYFLFPLQLDSDAQIRLHSPFAGVKEALKVVLESFAKHAPAHSRLLVKEHPLDNGVRNWELETSDLAARFGIAERVDYLAWGDIETISERALGMVTINSTSGTLALAMGVPVVALGTAIYDLPDLTCQTGLDRFWNEAPPPDGETFAAFRRVLIDCCLIPGGFFSDEALNKVVAHAIARFDGRQLQSE